MIWTYFGRGHIFECEDRLRLSFPAEARQRTPVKVTTYAVEWRRSGASGAGSPFDLIFDSQSSKHWALGFLFFHVFSALLWKSRAIECIECHCCGSNQAVTLFRSPTGCIWPGPWLRLGPANLYHPFELLACASNSYQCQCTLLEASNWWWLCHASSGQCH